MFVHTLQLRHFRNCESGCLEFGPQINLILGANAQGKTSLLEALYLCIAGRSFRTSQLQDLIRYEAPRFQVEIRFVKTGVEQRIRITYGEGERQILYNSTPTQAAAALLGIVPGVVTTTDDVNLVRGAPQGRRHYLDVQISQTDPLYLHHLTRYHRAMRQRNHLLRQRRLSGIESWESEMATSAAYIVKVRAETVDELTPYMHNRYQRLTHQGEDFALVYKSTAPLKASLDEIRLAYLHQYQQLRERETHIGQTLQGPHRDDLMLTIDSRDARFFASEGQQRSSVVALRLAEYDRIYKATGLRPVLIIDDVGISFDEERSSRLFTQLSELGQVFLTSARDLSSFFRREVCQILRIHAGCLEEASQ